MFENAVRQKLRFATIKGQLSVEELWDLNLSSLDSLAKAVNKELKDSAEESFIPASRSTGNKTLELRLDILKHVINTKVAEQELAKNKLERKAKIAQLKELAANKSNEQLASKSLEDLQKMIAELESV